jgi:hypothetical protein
LSQGQRCTRCRLPAGRHSARPGPSIAAISAPADHALAASLSVVPRPSATQSDSGRLSGTTQAPASDHAGGGARPDARLGHVIRYIC